ncbi:MAG TPA: hypothetical protein V6D19_05985 [Stenomitos sp.]
MTYSSQYGRCQRYRSSSQQQVCILYPDGPVEIPCMDFAEVPGAGEDFSAAWYGNHLIVQPRLHLSQADRLALLETHPLFTGICPKCGAAIPADNHIHYDCNKCGWKADLG